MLENFNTHKFLYTLNDDKNIDNQVVEFVDRENNLKKITLKSLKIGSSPISCKLYSTENKEYLVPFIRIKRIFDKSGELIWDNSENETSDVKVIKGFKK